VLYYVVCMIVYSAHLVLTMLLLITA